MKTYSNIYNYVVIPVVCVIPTLISVTKNVGNILVDYIWNNNGFDYSNGTVVMQYSIDNGTTWQEAGTSLSSLQSGNGVINGVALGTSIKYRIICNGNGCDNQISNVIDAVFEDFTNNLQVVLTQNANILNATISGGVPPYDYTFNGDVNGDCGICNIDSPTGIGNNTTPQTSFTYENGYAGVSYDFSISVTDSNNNTAYSNVISLGGCLIFGTKITTPTQEKNIENIVVGELILDENKKYTEVKSVELLEVSRVFNINNGLLISSEWHIHLVKGLITQKQSIELAAGDVLIDKNNNDVVINSIAIINENTKVVNISTESKTYIANGILTHNKIPCQ